MVHQNSKCGRAAFAGALVVGAIGSCVLTGWYFGWEACKRLSPGLSAMNPTTAVTFILDAVALALLVKASPDKKSTARMVAARGLAGLAALIGLARFVGAAGGWDMGVDKVLFGSLGLGLQDRMAPNTAFNFLLFGAALACGEAKSRAVRIATEVIAVAVGIGALSAIVGYIYDVQSLYGLNGLGRMALHTAATFVVLAISFLLSHTDRGLLAVLAGNSAGGVVGRRLLPAAILVPVTLGWLTLHGETVGIYRSGFGEASFAIGNILVFTSLVCWSASKLFNLDLRREEAESAIRFNEQRYRSLVEATSAVVWDTPVSGQFEVEQPSWTAFTGQSFEELRGWGWLNAVHPDDQAETSRVWSAAVANRHVYEIEHRLRAQDQTYHDMLVRAVPILAEDGAILQFIGIHTDITERKRVEEELRWKTAFLEAQVNSSLDGILVVDGQRKKILQNSRLAELFHIPAHIAQGTDDDEQLRWVTEVMRFPEVFSQRVAYLMSHPGETTRDELELKDGTVLDRYSAPMLGARGKYYGRIWLFRDITEQRRAEQSIRMQAHTLDNIGQAVIATRLDGQITYVNRFAGELYGWPPGEMLGRNIIDVSVPQASREQAEKLLALVSREEKWSGECIVCRRDGTEFTVFATSTQLRDQRGEVIGVVGISVDISDRIRLQAQLFESQKLETVGKLAGGIAHEFNSILTAIIGQSELLLADLPPGSSLLKSATGISTAAGRAATLTRQLLAYGRKQMLQPETLDLNYVIAGMEGVLAHLMGGNVNIRIVPAPDLQAIKADAGQIEQVIMNIVMNARDAMPDGGKLTLETANVSFDGAHVTNDPEIKAGNYVMLAITDTGGGMTAEAKARLFEPFYSTKGVGSGTGLGLSTCYGIVKQSGGHLTVYSELTRGAVFKIYLPSVETQARSAPQRLDSPDLPRGTETILLVEDDPALREMAATLLERLGYTVLAAADGLEALQLQQQRGGHIDLLFTDVVMPQMSGDELATRVRSLYPLMRILFTSAYTENAILHQCVLNTGVAMLQKPFTPSALARKLRAVLDQSMTTETEAGLASS